MGRVGGLLMLVREVRIVTAVVARAAVHRACRLKAKQNTNKQYDSNGRQANSHSADDIVVFLSRAT
jgi:hypothetical protein